MVQHRVSLQICFCMLAVQIATSLLSKRNFVKDSVEVCAEEYEITPTHTLPMGRKADEIGPTYYDYLECVYDRLDLFDDRGAVKIDAMLNYISRNSSFKALFNKVLTPCKELPVEDNKGLNAYLSGKCMLEKLNRHRKELILAKEDF